jgi:hypothetical protein
MHNTIALSVATLIAVGIIGIGTFYLFSPQKISGSFGLNPPATDPNTTAWLRLKGIRDVASGVVVLTLMFTADRRSLALAILALAIIPLGDMSIILASGGSKSKAFSVHALTCAVMLAVGFFLLHAS